MAPLVHCGYTCNVSMEIAFKVPWCCTEVLRNCCLWCVSMTTLIFVRVMREGKNIGHRPTHYCSGISVKHQDSPSLWIIVLFYHKPLFLLLSLSLISLSRWLPLYRTLQLTSKGVGRVLARPPQSLEGLFQFLSVCLITLCDGP